MITYPYEIESVDGGRWVYRSNEDGDFIWCGVYVDLAGPTCEEMVAEIEQASPRWPKDSCVYHGPLREQEAKL